MLLRNVTAYLVLTCCLFVARAQQTAVPFSSLNLNKLTVDEGLSQVYVNVIFKDSEGFLWVGTDDGLNRYDGKEVLRYYYRFNDTTTMAANEVYGISEDRKGRIWLAHYNAGISIFDKKKNRFTRLGTGKGKLSSNRVYGLYSDEEGFIIARTVEGLSKINPDTWQVENFDTPAFQDLANTAHIDVLEQGGQYWFGSKSKGILRVNKQGKVMSAAAWDTARYGKSVFGLCKNSASQLLVVSEKGLFQLQISGEDFKVETIITDPALFAYATRVIRYDNSPYVWIATDQQGLLIVDLQQRKVVRHFRSEWVKDNLLSNSVLFLLQDNERNVFIGTSRGVNIYSPYNNLFNNYENVFRKFPSFGHPIYAIHELQDGNLLLGTGKGGAYYFDVKTLEVAPISIEGGNPAGKNTVIYHYTPLSAQQFLVSSSDGIYELSLAGNPLKLTRSKRFKELAALSSYPITDIYFQNDSIAWIASFTTGLFKWNYKTHSLQPFKKNEKQPESGPVDNQLQKIVPTTRGRLILCTKYGFSVFDPAIYRFQNILPGKNYPHELPARNVKYAYDDGNAIWVTTYGAGLQKWDKKEHVFTGYTTREGLPNDAVYSVIPDDYGRLWIGTNNGLAVLDPKSGEIKTYTTKDGLPDNEFNGHAAYKSASGKLFYSTLNGIISVNPFLENKNPYRPRIALTYLAAGNGQNDSLYNIHGQQSFTLPAGYNDIDIRFAALSFASPGNNRYKIWLTGFDKGWQDLGNKNEAHYSNLEPGKYVLKVVACNNTGTWSEKELLVQITILPFWYQTLAFKLLLLVGVVVLTIYLIRLYFLNRLRQQRLEYEKMLAVQSERQRISSEIHDDVGAGLSGVRLLAELTKNKFADREVQHEVSKIHTSVSELSAKMREVIWSLNSDNDTLENLLFYIQRQAYQLFENSSIILHVSLPSADVPDLIMRGEVRRHIYLSVKEALHNCLKHSSARNCYLTMHITDHMLYIKVADDGKGFSKEATEQFGNGLPGMKRRMQQVNGSFLLETKEQTIIHLAIPLNTKA